MRKDWEEIVTKVCEVKAKYYRARMSEQSSIGWEDLAQQAKLRCYRRLAKRPNDIPLSYVVQICNYNASGAIIDYLRPRTAQAQKERKHIAEAAAVKPKYGSTLTSKFATRAPDRRKLIDFLARAGDIAAKMIPSSGAPNAVKPRSMIIMLMLRNNLRLSLRATKAMILDDPALLELMRGNVPSLHAMLRWEKLYLPHIMPVIAKVMEQYEQEGNDDE